MFVFLAEIDWYKSQSLNINDLGELYGKVPVIWKEHAANTKGEINSNYGYAPGCISLSGFNYSDESKNSGFKMHEWLSGGAIMHEKEKILYNIG